MAAALVSGVLAVVGLAGCGGPADAGDLRSAAGELASVGGPDGHAPVRTEVVGCDDDAEMPAAYAVYDHDGPKPAPYDREATDAYNAEMERIGDWYAPRWSELGWDVDESGHAFKEVDGRKLRAAIDASGDGYAIVVVDDGAGLCS